MLEEIKKMIEIGLNYSEISKKTSLHRTTISKICKEHNLKVKRVKNYQCEVCLKDLGENEKNNTKCKTCVTRLRRLRVKIKSIEYLGGECVECGYKKHLAALTFHHLDPSLKEFQISNSSHSKNWGELCKELDKCVILCSNCHNIEHSKYNDEKLLKYL